MFLHSYATWAVAAVVGLGLFYYIYTRFYGLFAMYNCLTTNMLWRLSHGKFAACFKGAPQQCAQVDRNGIYGFCYDGDYHGVGIGEPSGPYGYPCNDWVFAKEDCYPETCELANTSKRFGWCVERQRAYRGTSCGPDKAYGITCAQWLWNAPEKCATLPKCPAGPPPLPKCPAKPKVPKLKPCDECLCKSAF